MSFVLQIQAFVMNIPTCLEQSVRMNLDEDFLLALTIKYFPLVSSWGPKTQQENLRQIVCNTKHSKIGNTSAARLAEEF
jgi:hypothetical protein